MDTRNEKIPNILQLLFENASQTAENVNSVYGPDTESKLSVILGSAILSSNFDVQNIDKIMQIV